MCKCVLSMENSNMVRSQAFKVELMLNIIILVTQTVLSSFLKRSVSFYIILLPTLLFALQSFKLSFLYYLFNYFFIILHKSINILFILQLSIVFPLIFIRNYFAIILSLNRNFDTLH